MEQFVLVPAYVYNNKVLNTQTVTKQELPKYQAEQNPTYRIASLKKELNKELFAKADIFVDKILSRGCIKLSNSQILILAVVKSGVLLSDFLNKFIVEMQKIRTNFFTLLDAAVISPSLVPYQNAKVKERGNCVPFKI